MTLHELIPYLPFLIPFAAIQLGLMVAALIHIFTHGTYRMGNRLVWVIVCICVNTIGPVLYFCFGRSDAGKDDEQ